VCVATRATTSATTQPFHCKDFGSNEHVYVFHRTHHVLRLCVAAAFAFDAAAVAVLRLLLLRFVGAATAESLQQSQLAHPAAVSWTRRLLQQGRTAHTIPSKEISSRHTERPATTFQFKSNPIQTLKSCKAFYIPLT